MSQIGLTAPKRRSLSMIAFLFAFILGILFVPKAAFAETMTYQITGTFDQSGMRGILSSVNEFRTSDTWYWNSDDVTKTEVSGLDPFIYDYGLEQVAMQRAAECAFWYGWHTRPDLSGCLTAFPEELSKEWRKGENIAAGLKSPTAVYYAWREDDADYAGQAHRRGMLYFRYNYIGMASFTYNGTTFFVQEFCGSPTSVPEPSESLDGERTMTIVTDTNPIAGGEISMTQEVIYVVPGEGAALPSVEAKLDVSNGWGGDHPYRYPYGQDIIPVEPSRLEVADPDIAFVEDGRIVAKAGGATSLVATLDLPTGPVVASVPVVVTGFPDMDATVSLVGGFVYDGAPKTPAPTVASHGSTLVPGVDYKATYANNVAAGTATCYVAGLGSHAGTMLTGTFEIDPCDVAGARVDVTCDATAQYGTDSHPSIILKDGDARLVEGVDYSVQVTDTAKLGPATAIITGMGNYCGSVTADFEVVPRVVDDQILLSAISDQPYTGEAVCPRVSVRDAREGRWLVRGVDYTAEYADNIEPGEATVNITFCGVYTGALAGHFEISRELGDNLFAFDVRGAYRAADARALFDAVNEYRTQNGLAELVWDNDLERSARKVSAWYPFSPGNYAWAPDGSHYLSTMNIAHQNSFIDIQASHGNSTATSVQSEMGNLRMHANGLLSSDCVAFGAACFEGSPTGYGNSERYWVVYFSDKETDAPELDSGDVETHIPMRFSKSGFDRAALSASPSALSLKIGDRRSAPFAASVKTNSSRSNFTAVWPTEVTSSDNGVVVVEGDEIVCIGAGTATITAHLNVPGADPLAATCEVTVAARDISKCTVAAPGATYSAKPQKPTPVITDGAYELREGVDYRVECKGECIDAGKYSYDIVGMGAYGGVATKQFVIAPYEISGPNVTVAPLESKVYTGG